MDLKLVREEAIEGTTRFFWDNRGFVPERGQRGVGGRIPAPVRVGEGAPCRRRSQSTELRRSPRRDSRCRNRPHWAELTGAPTQIRWAASLRAERISEIRDPGVREWLATTWTRAKSWIDTQELPTPVFLQRIAPHYQEYRKKADEEARVRTRAAPRAGSRGRRNPPPGRKRRHHRRGAGRIDRHLRPASAGAAQSQARRTRP